MIKTTIDGKEVRIKKSEILKALTEGSRTEVVGALEILMGVEELKKVDKFYDHCEFTAHKIAENQKPMVYESYLQKIKIAIENHGIPQRGHLDDHASRLLREPAFAKYMEFGEKQIEILKKSTDEAKIKEAMIAESVYIVRTHYHEGQHSQDYEMHLNHLHQIDQDLKKNSSKDYAAKKNYVNSKL